MQDAMSLANQLSYYNEQYRKGTPVISDAEYDALVEKLRSLQPDHPFLHRVEEEGFERRKVRHPRPMLSTEKAYTIEELKRFFDRVKKTAGQDEVKFRVTPKLDGQAGRYENDMLVTRGDGENGFDVTDAFGKGVVALGPQNSGLGEIVMNEAFFQAYLSDHFTHPRNVVVGVINSDVVSEKARMALDYQAVIFVPYTQLPSFEGTDHELLERFRDITQNLQQRTPYRVDGMVIDVVDPGLREKLGATNHHHRWQIAFKEHGETAPSPVREITWQTGRGGAVTPVLEVEPTTISGATIRRVNAHHAGFLEQKQIGPGSVVEIVRAGEVIPKALRVLHDPATPRIPDSCPECSQSLIRDEDILRCGNISCTAQVEGRLRLFFKTLSIDWFGTKTIKKLVQNGYTSLPQIYSMTEAHLENIGFGPGQAKNLAGSLRSSLETPQDDWRFLAAFGVPSLGTGESRKLLKHHYLENIFGLTVNDLVRIDGFGEKKGRTVVQGLDRIRDQFQQMLNLGFHLNRTLQETADESQSEGPLANTGLVFTGKMSRSREKMQEVARENGGIPQTSVSKNTDYLVCGENVGQKKIDKAKSLGATAITEEEFWGFVR